MVYRHWGGSGGRRSPGPRCCSRRGPSTRPRSWSFLASTSPTSVAVRHRRCSRKSGRGGGENLQDHLQIRTVFTVRDARTLNTHANTAAVGKFRVALEYALWRSGPMSMARSQFGMFAKPDRSRVIPDLEYYVQPLSSDRLGDPLHPFPRSRCRYAIAAPRPSRIACTSPARASPSRYRGSASLASAVRYPRSRCTSTEALCTISPCTRMPPGASTVATGAKPAPARPAPWSGSRIDPPRHPTLDS